MGLRVLNRHATYLVAQHCNSCGALQRRWARYWGRLKGKAIISLNDHPDIRRTFVDHHIETTDIRYIVGGDKGSEASEVLIFS